MFRGHNSQRLLYPAGKHPEINDQSYLLSKKYTKTSPTRVRVGIMVGFLDYMVTKIKGKQSNMATI